MTNKEITKSDGLRRLEALEKRGTMFELVSENPAMQRAFVDDLWTKDEVRSGFKSREALEHYVTAVLEGRTYQMVPCSSITVFESPGSASV